MKLHLASTAELYAEHRRTGSDRKRQRIAAELQRRHDEQNMPRLVFPVRYNGQLIDGLSLEAIERPFWWMWNGREVGFEPMMRFDFALCLPQSAFANRKSAIGS